MILSSTYSHCNTNYRPMQYILSLYFHSEITDNDDLSVRLSELQQTVYQRQIFACFKGRISSELEGASAIK